MIINYNGVEYICDDNWSFKDLTTTACIFDELSNKVIYGACFLKEEPDYQIFKGNVSGLTLIKCILDNILIPEGVTVIDCWHRRFKVQNDLRDWIVDENNNPTELMCKEYWEKEGVFTNPNKIPSEKIILGDKTLLEKLREVV